MSEGLAEAVAPMEGGGGGGGGGPAEEVRLQREEEELLALIDLIGEVLREEWRGFRARVAAGAGPLAGLAEAVWAGLLGQRRSLVRRLADGLAFYTPQGRLLDHVPRPRPQEEHDNRPPRYSLLDVAELDDPLNNSIYLAEGVGLRCVNWGPLPSPSVSPSSDPYACRRRRVESPDWDGLPPETALPSGALPAPAASSTLLADSTLLDEAKYDAMQTEIQALKAQMAALLRAQLQPDGPPPQTRRLSANSGDSGISEAAPPSSSRGPPAPPPPPPPPPPPSLRKKLGTPSKGKENTPTRSGAAAGSRAAAAKSAGVPSMSDVLAELHKVKLRPAAQRGESPRTKALPSTPSDPGAFLAQALRKKFAATLRAAEESPASEPASPSRSDWDDASPDVSPVAQAPRLNPRPRRRSSLAPLGQNGHNIPPPQPDFH